MFLVVMSILTATVVGATIPGGIDLYLNWSKEPTTNAVIRNHPYTVPFTVMGVVIGVLVTLLVVASIKENRKKKKEIEESRSERERDRKERQELILKLAERQPMQIVSQLQVPDSLVNVLEALVKGGRLDSGTNHPK